MQVNQGFHQGLLEQRIDRLQRHIQQLDDEVASVDDLRASSPQLSTDTLRELEHSLRAEILRLQYELDTWEAELRLSRDKIVENEQRDDG